MAQKKNIENITIGVNILVINKIFKYNLPSFCTSNFDVISAILLYSKIFNLPVLLECTSNQVNQNKGYSGLKPKDFYKKVISLSKKIKLNKKKIIFGADHLGPLPWKNLDKKKAFKNAKNLLKSILNENFQKIHLDTTIICRNDKKFNLDKIRERFFDLFKSIPHKKLKKIYLVVGSEVPYAGGGSLNNSISTFGDVKKDYQIYNSIINKNQIKLKEFALVIEPGMSFSNNGIITPNFKNLKKISKFSRNNNIFFEAHSTDYQPIGVLKKLVNSNFKFLKVGPELTFQFNECIKYMLNIEKKFIPKKKDRSNLKEDLISVMNKNPKYWKSYYKGSKSNINYLKFNSPLDRIRYYWDNKKIKNSKKKLFKNINKLPINLVLKSKKINNIYHHNFKKYKIKNSELLILKFTNQTFQKYYKACGFNLKS